MLAEGKIKLRSAEISHYDTSGVVFKDGSREDADVIVWANGYFDTIGPVRSVLVSCLLTRQVFLSSNGRRTQIGR